MSKVGFYADGILLGEVTSEPYEFNWTGAVAGVHTLTAIATDDGGKFTNSTDISVTVIDPNASILPPTISLTEPINGANFVVNTPVQLAATANDPDGVITKVAFYANGTLLSEVTTEPYQFTWSSAVSGNYDIHAITTDDGGNTTTSSTAQIIITGSISTNVINVSLQNGINGYDGTVDTYIYEFHNTTHFGDEPVLKDKPSGSKFSSLVRFAIFQSEGGSVPDGSTITSATLSLYKISFYDHVFRAHRVLENWTENDASWEQREPGVLWNTSGANDFGLDVNAVFDGEGTVLWQPEWMTIDVTSGLQAMSASGINYGWKLIPISGNSNVKVFASSEYIDDPSLRPILEIEYIPNTGSFNSPPTVSLTAPLSGTEFNVGTSIALAATATDTDGFVSKVGFYADGILLGEVTSEPYEFNWTGAVAGVHTLTAIATDDGGKFTNSTDISVTVIDPNASILPPTISLTEPINGANFVVNTPVQLAATANDPDGVITKVAFYANGTLLSEVTTEPYQFTWSSAVSGNYDIHAITTDDGGNTTTSSTAQIIITGSISTNVINVSLQNGINGYDGTVDTYIYEFHNTTHFGDEPVLKDKPSGSKFSSLVRFAIFQSEGGSVPDGSTITSATLSLYKISFYDHVFRAHRVLENWTENDASWEQREPGVLWNTSGANDFGLDVNAVFDGEGTAMWQPEWMAIDVTSGLQAMSASGINYGWKLIPISGNSNVKVFASSEYIDDPSLRPILEIEYIPNTGSFNSPPTVSLTAPLSGTEFNVGTSIALAATATDTDGFVSKVGFYADGILLGEVTSEPYEFNWTGAVAGVHTLTAIATDDGGKANTSLAASITVSDLTNVPPTAVMTDPAVGSIHELGTDILMAATANDSDGNVTKVAFYANGSLLGEVTQPPYEFSWADAPLGMHALQAIATDNGALIGKSDLFEITVSQSTVGNNFLVSLQNGLSGYNATQDSYVYEFHNFSNFGEATTLRDDANGSRLGIFVQFAIFESEGGPIPDLANITSATLKLYKTSFYNYVYRAHPLLLAWSENQVTWEENQLGSFWNEPGGIGLDTDISATFDGEASAAWSPGWLSINVTQGLNAIKSGRKNYGWRLIPVSGNNNTKVFISSEYAEDTLLRPTLEVEYILQ